MKIHNVAFVIAATACISIEARSLDIRTSDLANGAPQLRAGTLKLILLDNRSFITKREEEATVKECREYKTNFLDDLALTDATIETFKNANNLQQASQQIQYLQIKLVAFKKLVNDAEKRKEVLSDPNLWGAFPRHQRISSIPPRR
ncbi:hypothetical protein BGX23_001331 [Mortierella sp. AD031]|nr:hypothetical protein BGX23_001331 [Mortierella sp. AD031]KAG0198081.1 hypothetical protein BGX33_012595 [Mortierella sp. NVP41]